MESGEELRTRLADLERRVRELEAHLHVGSAVSPVSQGPAPVVEPQAVPPPIPVRAPRPYVQPLAPAVKPVVVAPVPQMPRAPSGPRPTPIADFLRKVYVLPPKVEPGEGAGLEQQLAAWWMTRIGGLLAVIALVFLGLYVSRFSSPLVRVFELFAISAGVFGLGLFLERRTPQFGRVLLSAGLAMFYFTTFAMYAVTPLKIVEETVLAACLQLGAVLVVFGVAWWKNSQHMATMAVGFAGLSQVAALYEGLSSLAMPGAVCLVLVAAGLYALRRWLVPLLASVVLLVLLHLFFAALGSPMDWSQGQWRVWIAVLAVPLVLVTAVDSWLRSRGYTEEKGWRYALQTGTLGGLSSTAVLVAWVVLDIEYGGNEARWVCWIFGGLLVGVAVWYASREENSMAAMPLIKGSSIIALGFIFGFDGAARWMALLLQAAIMVFSAWRGRLRLLTVLVLGIWVVAALTYLFHTERTPLPEGLAWFRLLFILGSAATLASAWRFAPRLFILGEDGYGQLQAYEDSEYAKAQGLVVGGVLGCLVVATTGLIAVQGWYVPTAFLMGAAVFAIAIRWSPAQAVSALVPVAAYCLIHFLLHDQLSSGQQLAAGGSVLVMLLPVSLALRETKWSFGIAFFLMLVVWSVLTERLCAPEMAVFVAALSGVAVLRIGKAFENRIISWLAFVPLAIISVTLWYGPFLVAWPMMVSVAAAYGFAVFSNHVWPHLTERRWVHSVPALIVGLSAVTAFGGAWPGAEALDYALLGAAVTLLVFAGCGWWSLVHGAVFLMVGYVEGYGESTWLSFLAFFGLAFGLSVLGHRMPPPKARIQWLHQLWCWVTAGCAMGLALEFFLRDDLSHVTTIGWGGAALLLVLGGLYFRSFPMRMVGFGGLALSIGRVFVVDVKDTFHRIIAFAVLSVVFLILGYLYSRFRSVIADSGDA